MPHKIRADSSTAARIDRAHDEANRASIGRERHALGNQIQIWLGMRDAQTLTGADAVTWIGMLAELDRLSSAHRAMLKELIARNLGGNDDDDGDASELVEV